VEKYVLEAVAEQYNRKVIDAARSGFLDGVSWLGRQLEERKNPVNHTICCYDIERLIGEE
jgi:hypothetical protein